MRFSLRLRDLSIRTKIAIPLLIMGAISGATAVYGGMEYGRIQKTYSELIYQRSGLLFSEIDKAVGRSSAQVANLRAARDRAAAAYTFTP